MRIYIVCMYGDSPHLLHFFLHSQESVKKRGPEKGAYGTFRLCVFCLITLNPLNAGTVNG